MTKKKLPNTVDLIPVERIERRTFLIRGHKVMLDADLAELYDVETKYLKRQVNRNQDHFPEDFMLRLTGEESRALRFQIGTLKRVAVGMPVARHPPHRSVRER